MKAPGPLALLVDDEASICEALAGVLKDEGWRSRSVHSGRQALIECRTHPPDLIFLDVAMPGMDGIETLQALKEMRDDIPVVIMSGHGTIETAVKTTKLGAFDFLEKPLSLDKILPLLGEVVGQKDHGAPRQPPTRLIGASAAFGQIQKQILLVAPRNASVLITGENGTGKEVVAMSLHAHSPRAKGPFVAVNCAAIPESLIESELFGHEKGAFTGATSQTRGRFELADGGTLFLDEIGDMSLRTQAKILRVLQEQRFERVGGEEPLKVDVRIVAATNKPLPEEIAAGRFREDLYYRLNVVPFHLPPLRERPGDVQPLALHFLGHVAGELKEPVKALTVEALRALEGYAWPGNVRELRNVIERLCILVPGDEIDLADLPDGVLAQARESGASAVLAPGSLKEAKSDFERTFILDKLQENQGNVSKTAEAIGIERSNLHRKLRAYNIDPKRLKE